MIKAVLYGTLVGHIWMPDTECTKDIQVDLNRKREFYIPNRAGSLEPMASSIVSDGDFRSCLITDDSYIELTSWRVNKSGVTVRRAKTFPITKFKSIAHCIGERP